MILCGVLKPREATNALPVSMLLLIVGALAMAGALSATGAGDLIGGIIANLVKGLGGNSYLVGFIFFIIPFIMTQFMSNDDFSSDCDCNLRKYWRKSGRINDFNSGSLSFRIYDTNGNSRSSLHNGRRRI